MKKQFAAIAVMALAAQIANGQTSTQGTGWKNNGNTATSSDYIGTTNNQSLVFKTNNLERGKFDANGNFVINNGTLLLNPNAITNQQGQFLLKVGGNAYFEKGLTVKEKITYTTLLKGPRIDIDTIRVDSTGGIFGKTKIHGDLHVKQDLKVTGDALFKNTVTFEKGFMFDSQHKFSYIPATSTTGEKYILGKSTPPGLTCIKPNLNPSLFLQGGFISYVQNGLVNSNLTMTSASWNGDGIIEVEGLDDKGATGNALMINYFCGRNTLINVNNSLPNGGGWVFMGEQVNMAKHVEIGSRNYGINDAANTALEIHVNNGKGIKFRTWNNGLKLISVENSNFPSGSPYTVYADGRTYIGVKTQQNSPLHSDALLTVSGKMVAQSCYVTLNNWADDVFDPSYQVLSLPAIESFYKTNKHLPEVPSEQEVLEKGIDVGEMNRLLLKKIEELTVLMVEQDKKLSAYAKEVEALKAELNH